MVGLPSRHRSLFLLMGVILLQVLLLAVQIKRDSQGRLIRVWTVSAVSPVQRSGSWGVGKIRDAWRHYFALSDTARQNEQLIRENGALKLEIMQLEGKSAEADRLAALLNFKQKQAKVPMVVARVIGSSADPNSNVNRILAAHKAAGGSFNPYRSVSGRLTDCSDKGRRS